MSITPIPAKPNPVRWALVALLAACLLDLVTGVATIISAQGSAGGASASIAVGIVVSGLAPLALLAAVARGRRWALVVYALLLALGLLLTVASLQVGIDAGWWRVVFRLAYLVLGVAGVVLLFMPAGRDWFAACRAARRGEAAGA